jgi:hypothetical protein
MSSGIIYFIYLYGSIGRIPSSPSVFTADEYRAWLQRTPSTSAIYERIRTSRDILQSQAAPRFTYSAENLLDRSREVSEFQVE